MSRIFVICVRYPGNGEDTINLIGHALKKLMSMVAEQQGRALIEAGKRNVRHDLDGA